MARPRRDRLVDAEVAKHRVALDLRAPRPARVANDNGPAQAKLDRLWPVAAALLVLAWAVLSVFS